MNLYINQKLINLFLFQTLKKMLNNATSCGTLKLASKFRLFLLNLWHLHWETKHLLYHCKNIFTPISGWSLPAIKVTFTVVRFILCIWDNRCHINLLYYLLLWHEKPNITWIFPVIKINPLFFLRIHWHWDRYLGRTFLTGVYVINPHQNRCSVRNPGTDCSLLKAFAFAGYRVCITSRSVGSRYALDTDRRLAPRLHSNHAQKSSTWELLFW